ncbi:MAG: ribonuclease H-like domain-containing protein [Acidobacteria bacterium]|nr:ribonuclease H-like domain-containing protein [Acidobacteriota bacterium]MBU4307742.1 ribonuclease H-like domain-containing protein [Acidobacteriota bacterium]MBU4404590.1 ribonuclease H-like domain-containing protein [Acidobacteriota bacterium]MCG2812829.1 ribonuclease H-like domain-containing protein [Candidatus Aminicenantes bacterium]
MRKLKDRLHDLDKNHIQEKWQRLDNDGELSTREKLEKLVRHNLKQKDKPVSAPQARMEPAAAAEPFLVKDFYYALDGRYGKVRLGDWLALAPGSLAIIAGSEVFAAVDPRRVVFFDSETTGLAGGTGTIPFMLGFGFFSEQSFQVKIFMLQDLDREGDFLLAVAEFLRQGEFSAAVTYNGKAFDFPLLETRYILQRQRFPLLDLPHLDFLFPARTIWKNTYDSRKLGYLGEMLLGLSRSDDIEASSIPALYFSFLRSQAFSLIEPVMEHNAMDLVGLAAVVLLGLRYLEDYSLTADGGEILGLGMLCERAGLLEKAEAFYQIAKDVSAGSEVQTKVLRRLSVLMKKKKLYSEALELWQALSAGNDLGAMREISIHYEHREQNYAQAVTFVEKALNGAQLSPGQQQELEKRLERLRKKIAKLEEKNEIT